MTDPLSITASIVGVTVPALHGIRLLLDDLQQIQDAPDAVQRLKNDIHSTDLALKSLQAVKEEEWKLLGADIADRSKTITTSCVTACEAFRTDLQRWTRHSGDGKLSWQDRANVGFLKQGRMKSMSGQLQSCKTTIVSVVSIATLYGSIRQAHLTEEIRSTISTKQTEITSAIKVTDQQLIEVAKKLEQVCITNNVQTEDENAGNTFNTLREIEDERNALRDSRKLLNELLSKAQEDAVAKAAAAKDKQPTKVIFGSQGSGFQIGISNAPISGITFGASEPKKS